MEIDREIISTVILLSSADSFKKGCCQLQAKVCARITGQLLAQACPGRSVVWWIDCPAITIAVDLGHKETKQTIILNFDAIYTYLLCNVEMSHSNVQKIDITVEHSQPE